MKKKEQKALTLEDVYEEVHDVVRSLDRLAITVIGNAAATEDINRRLGNIEKQLTKMVTKDHHNEKIALVRGDLTQLARKGDGKLMRLAGALYDEGVLPEKELKALYEMEPFAVLTLPKK